jgi:DNA-binding IclR family transcriptional regulator
MDKKNGPITGAQSAGKVLKLLKIVGARHPHGVRLKEVIAESGQDRSTAHRLLACLVEEGFVARSPIGKVYRLDMEAMQLGLGSDGLAPLVDRFRPVMKRLARSTGDTVFLVVRSGDHALCLHREEGSFPIKAFVVEPGTRRLLGFSSVGVAVLANLPDAQTATTYGRHVVEYAALGLHLADLKQRVKAARACGFAETQDFRTNETSGVGCAFRLSSNSSAGISIAAINSRMPAQRRKELGAELTREVQPLAWQESKIPIC